jgi:general secretion pathway protein A
VNLLCDRALLAGYAAGERRVGPDHVGVAAREILGARRRLMRRRPWIRRSYVAGAALALLVSGALAWQQWTRVEPRVAVSAPRVVVDSTPPSVSTPPVGAARIRSEASAEPETPFVGPPPASAARDAG